jgi:hypothetical protein
VVTGISQGKSTFELQGGNMFFNESQFLNSLQGGQHVLSLVDFFGGSFIIFALTTLEVFAVGWIYGKKNVFKYIAFLLSEVQP